MRMKNGIEYPTRPPRFTAVFKRLKMVSHGATERERERNMRGKDRLTIPRFFPLCGSVAPWLFIHMKIAVIPRAGNPLHLVFQSSQPVSVLDPRRALDPAVDIDRERLDRVNRFSDVVGRQPAS